ncbi:MAG: alpha-amylase family glycosyl hydrolase [Succinivibrionaceae bacterium]
MCKKNVGLKLLSVAIGASALLYSPAQAKNYESEMVIVHPFQWTYDNLAKECTEYLGPAGVDGIQISQPAEHINRRDVWWAVYQPINFKNFTTMTGNEQQLRNMIKVCNEAGVKVFADAVLNQRGSGSGTGLGGSHYGNGSNYQDGFDASDFRTSCTIGGYTDANHVRTCCLSGMPDTRTDNPSTQDKIAGYLKTLMDMGIYGFRIDAAKHMGYTDIEAILSKTAQKAGRRPPVYQEVIGADREAEDIQPIKYTGVDNAVVTDFSYVGKMTNAFDYANYGEALNLGTAFDSNNAQVFVNNHDNEAKRCSAGTCSMGTQNNPRYTLAQSWLVVWPVGKVRQVYSGYSFSQHDPAGPIAAERCQGGWLCQHREPIVLNAFRFARATRGQGVTTKGYDNGALWINRGNKGFYVMNTTGSEFEREFTVELPDGDYKNILSSLKEDEWPTVSVRNHKAKIKVKGMSAAAICDGEYCGVSVDPCEKDPTSASCLCKDDSDKNLCSAYCSSSGANSKSCVCKGEEVDKNGLCQSYCSLNPSEDNCYCVLNPNDDECQTFFEPTKNLCYAGTSNKWKFDQMTFNKRTGQWTINLELDGKGDDSGEQRFKVADGCSWASGVYGTGDTSDTLALNTSKDGDVILSGVGFYLLTIDDLTMKFSVTPVQSNKAPEASFSLSQNGLKVAFSNTSSDPDGDNLKYSWNFGNGSTSTEKDPVVTYAEAGTYHVTLSVDDGNGGSDKYEKDVVISVTPQVVYTKVALRTSNDNYGTFLLEQLSSDINIWKTTNFEFTGDSSNFKIEATDGTQCVILGGKVGAPLTAAGDFIVVDKGTYDITFDAKTKKVTMTKSGVCVGELCGQACDSGSDCIGGICKGPDCVVDSCKGSKCGQICNSGSDCVDGICKGNGVDCDYVSQDNTKTNCDKDGTTNNCEVSKYSYDFLGAIYTKEATTFRIWSPDSSNVTVDVNGKTYNLSKTSMNGYDNVYEVKVSGDLDLVPYQFKINGKAVRDPYGKMVVPASYSGSDGKGVASSDNRNVVMNMRATDLKDGWAVRPVFINREDAIIYEAHVRDFTVDSSSGVSDDKKGRYLGMVETGTKSKDGLATGIDHLKELGITHVQLLPVYDYGSCSDVDSQSDSCYNWGYDPVNFNVPEDRYTSVFKTDKYRQKVQEFKEMVNEFHKNGIRVIMDVVYNHTYAKEMFENITGKYYTSTDLSGCGNSTDPKQQMVSRFIRDSLEYWATEYNIDGFRFDLVGIFDVNNFKEWGEYLNNKYPDRNFLMYGEPWNGYATDPSESTRVRLGTIRQGVSGHVGVFNGKYRECVKGGSDNAIGGFMFNQTYNDLGAGVSNNVECVSAGVKGGIGDNTNAWTPLFAADPEQSINYLTAHDNLTMADKITKMNASGTYASRLQAYGNGIMLVSQGIPFLHSGVEFSRSKNMDHNSYKTPGDVNNIKWGLKSTNKAVFDYYKGMIAMRKAHPAFRMTTRNLIEQNVRTSGQSGAIVVDINGSAVNDSWNQIKVVINSGNNLSISGVDGWKKKVNGVKVAEDNTTGNNTAEGTAVTIWYK